MAAFLSIKKDSNDRQARGIITVLVHHMQLKVVVLSVDSVLRWSVHMELQSVKQA